jgi:hypothetical protein
VKKISATILDFAKPLTDGLAADAPLDLRRDTLRIAITLWNGLVLQACGQGELLAELFERFRKMPHRDSVIMGALVRDMVLRKHTLYSDDLRLVGEWELRDLGDGEVSLRAVAHAPPKK